MVVTIILMIASVAMLANPYTWRRFWVPILLALRFLLVETPLRAITGRRRMTAADWAQLRRMEIECGLAEPEPRNEALRALMPGVTFAEFSRNVEANMAAFHAAMKGCSVDALRELLDEKGK